MLCWFLERDSNDAGHARNRTLSIVASSNWGCGAFSGSQWFMLPWKGNVSDEHITVKQLAPVVLVAAGVQAGKGNQC